MRTLRLAAAGVAGATFVFTGLAVVRAGSVLDWVPHWLTPFLALAFVAPATVGLLIAIRRPRNRIAWILLLGPFAMTIQLPLGLALGIGPQYMIAMWTAVGGVLFFPANGTQIAAAQQDETGTTTLGKRVVDHSFQLPLQVAWIVTALVGIGIAWLFFD